MCDCQSDLGWTKAARGHCPSICILRATPTRRPIYSVLFRFCTFRVETRAPMRMRREGGHVQLLIRESRHVGRSSQPVSGGHPGPTCSWGPPILGSVRSTRVASPVSGPFWCGFWGLSTEKSSPNEPKGSAARWAFPKASRFPSDEKKHPERSFRGFPQRPANRFHIWTCRS